LARDVLLPRSPPDAAAAPPPRVPTIADPLNERELLLRPTDRPGGQPKTFSVLTRGCPTLSPECECSAAAVNAQTQLPHEYLYVSSALGPDESNRYPRRCPTDRLITVASEFLGLDIDDMCSPL